MLSNFMKIYFLAAEKSGFEKFIEGLREEFLDIVEDFTDFFVGIKESFYDMAIEKFGEMPVNLLLLGILFLAIMLIFLKIVNK